MATQLIPFTFETHNVRIHMDESGTPWWVVADICAVLALTNPSETVKRLEQDALRKTEVVDISGQSQLVWIVSEPGLYELIFRSNKPEAKRFRAWVFEDVLPAIRKTGRYEIAQPAALPPLSPPSQREQLESIELGAQLLEMFGGMTDRDKLMFQDCVRNVMFSGQKLLPQYTGSYGFSVAERVTHLGYRLDRRQQASFYPVLGKRLATEYRSRHGAEPEKETRYVDGANRQVAWYPQDCADWVDTIIQSFMASLDIFAREGA